MASKILKTTIFPFITMTISTAFLIVFVYSTSSSLSFFSEDIKEGDRLSDVSNKDSANEKSVEETGRWKETDTVSFHYHGREITVPNENLPDEWTVVSDVEITELYNKDSLIKLIQELNGVTFFPKQEISLLTQLEEKNFSIKDEIELSIIATALYQLLLETNFEIEERHISDVLPDYSKLGLEAFVDKDHDLAFSNPNETPFVLSLTLEDHSLVALLLGEAFGEEYRINLADEKIIQPERMIEHEQNVDDIVIKQAGQIGHQVTVYREIFFRNGDSDQQLISIDYYSPIDVIEVHRLHTKDRDGHDNNQFIGIKGY